MLETRAPCTHLILLINQLRILVQATCASTLNVCIAWHFRVVLILILCVQPAKLYELATCPKSLNLFDID